MAEDIAIDSNAFFSRLSSFYASWKADKRSGNALFGNAGSMVILMGKTDEENSFQKNNAMHVSDPFPNVEHLSGIHMDYLANFIVSLLMGNTSSSGCSDTNFQPPFSSSQPKRYTWSPQPKKVIIADFRTARATMLTCSNYSEAFGITEERQDSS